MMPMRLSLGGLMACQPAGKVTQVRPTGVTDSFVHGRRKVRKRVPCPVTPQHRHVLPPTGVVSACTVSVVQPGYLEVDYTHQAVTIECSFFTTDCPPEKPVSLWFRYGAHQTETLCLDRCSSETDKFTVTETLIKNQVSLTINRVASNDSAIYICGIAFPNAVAPGAKQTGKGTMLVVRGQSTKAYFITS